MKMKRSIITIALFFIVAFSCKRTSVIDSQPPEPVWQSLGLTGKWVHRVVPADPFLYACLGGEGLWRLDLQASDTSWVYLGLADSSLGRQRTFGVRDVVISENNPNWLLAIVQPLVELAHGIFRSLDGGKTWLPAGSDLMYTTAGGHSGYFHPDRFLQSENTVLTAGQGFNVFRTRDFGATWEAITGGVEPGLLEVMDLASYRQFTNIIWMGAETGFSTEFFAKSLDAGNTWNLVTPLQNIETTGVNTLVLNHADTNIVYVGLQEQIIKTIDAGRTWNIVFEQEAVAMLVDANDGSHLWASTNEGVWETREAGAAWVPITDIPTPIRVEDMVWDEKRQVVYMDLQWVSFNIVHESI